MTDYLDLLHGNAASAERTPMEPVQFSGTVHPYAAGALRDEAEQVASAPTGTRNDALNRAWFKMGRHVSAGSIDVETVRTTLTQAASAAGLDLKEIETVLRDGSTSALKNAASIPRVPPPREELPHLTVIVAPPAADELDAFWDARESLAHIHQFARARRVAPWAVLGNVLARVVAATPPGRHLPPLVGGRGSLNLFVGIVGKSGAGKGAADAAAHDAINVGHIETRNPGSGEGIVHAYVRRLRDGSIDQHQTALMFQVPEIDTLAALSKRTGTTLMPLLRSAWSGEQLGFTNADPTKNVQVEAHAYRFTMVAGIQPGRAATLLEDADGGTPQRFLWLPGTDPEAPDVAPEEPKQLDWSISAQIFANQPMGVPETARQAVDSARLGRLRGSGEDLDGHGLFTRLKVAAALALLEQRVDITEEDWTLSGTLMRVSDATRSAVQAHQVAEAQKANKARALAEADRQVTVGEKVAEAAVIRVSRGIERHLAAAPEGQMKRSELRGKFSADDRSRWFDVAIEHLRLGGHVEIEGDPEAGTKGQIVRSTK